VVGAAAELPAQAEDPEMSTLQASLGIVTANVFQILRKGSANRCG
jgi:hypothetical protein